jgi:hypothetical protein
VNQVAKNDISALCDTQRARPRTVGSGLAPLDDISGRRAAPASGTRVLSGVGASAALSTQSALRASASARLRVMAVAMLLLVAVGATITTVVEGDAPTKRLAWASLGVLFGSFAWAFYALRRDPDADETLVAKVATPLCLGVVGANLAFGLLSAFCAAVTLGLALFSSAVSRRRAAPGYGIIAVGYALCALLVQLGLIPHRPLLPLELASPWQWWAAVVAVELLYASAYAVGVASRIEQKRVVREFERAVRKASQREALLAEARDALKQGAGLGGPGRFTDQEIDGFRLGVVIGRGGMGEVYAAERLSDGEQAALKLLRVDLWGEKQALARFAREAKIVASIDSPHVVRVLEVSGPEAVCPYIAMELLSGVDLGTQLRERGRMSLADVADMMEQIASGLQVAHAASVVHRDLKPQNVFRAGGAHGLVTWKVLDFGVSKLLDAGEASLTAAEIIGTPQYMAPEQARGERNVDARADVYALSAIAYRSLTGEAPFRGDLHSILRSILEEMPEAPSWHARVPEDVDLVLAIGLAKRREDRFQNANELAEAFDHAARRELSPELRARARALLAEKPYRGVR